MEPGLKIIYDNYKLWYDTTKLQHNKAKKEFAQFKAIPNPTKEDLTTFNRMRDHLFQVHYMMMEAHLSVDNIRANYPENMQEQIDAYDLMSKRACWLIGEMAKYAKQVEKTINTSTSNETTL